MAKNIIVMAMSTLRGDVKQYQFTWKGWEKSYQYYSQLAPTSKMIQMREKSLDKVIILATSAVVKTQQVICDGKEIGTTAVDFYLNEMGIDKSEEGSRYEIVSIDDDSLTLATAKTVEIIRKFWKENREDEKKLWIDTQGGFRGVGLAINAVISLLKADEIQPSGVYGMDFNPNRELQHIQDQTNLYKIFDFVSGMNEFSRYGRAEQLGDYYKSVSDTEEVPVVIECMKSIAESIQMCDMVGFENNLKQLRELVKEPENKNDLLNIFWNQIKDDYGNLLNDSCTGLDIVAWFSHKKFYQQAITYIESKMPKEWVNKKKIIDYKKEKDTKVLKTLKIIFNKRYECDENMLVTQIAMECFDWYSIVSKGKKVDNFDNLDHLVQGRKEEYQTLNDTNNMIVNANDKKKKLVGELHISINSQVNANQVMDMILLYKLLKQERNNFNHMAETGARADQGTLGKVIRLFIEVGNKVYKDIEGE